MSGQISLRRVVRWGKYVDKEDRQRVEESFKLADRGCRVQESLQHSYSLAIAGMILVAEIDGYVGLDGDLLSRAFLVHDHGEGELGFDTHYIDKTAEKDLNEYLAFAKRYVTLEPETFRRFESAFLLQFAGKEQPLFPPQARAIMAGLRAKHPMEVLAFEAVERWDYVLYALEQFEALGDAKILVQTMRNQIGHLDRIAHDLPGFSKVVWTEEVRAWFRSLLETYEGQFIEQKGEK